MEGAVVYARDLLDEATVLQLVDACSTVMTEVAGSSGEAAG
ncbi:hypothetical protein [Pseudonocardia sp. ICBG1142]|nr:hypothetical protein [Pseudonocardia sp. ICBG1142]